MGQARVSIIFLEKTFFVRVATDYKYSIKNGLKVEDRIKNLPT